MASAITTKRSRWADEAGATRGRVAWTLPDGLASTAAKGRRAVRDARTGPTMRIDLNERIRRLSTLLFGVAGCANDLRLQLCIDEAPLRCPRRSVDIALLEAVSQMRDQLAGGGSIILRTRRVGHHVYLAIAARDGGAARPGPLRLATPAEGFAAARDLATGCHGRLRTAGPALLIVKLPTVLRLADRDRQVPACRPAPGQATTHDGRQRTAPGAHGIEDRRTLA